MTSSLTHSPKNRKGRRLSRHHRVRQKVSGTADRPRLSVFRSGEHLWAQVIDDISGKTIISVTDFSKEVVEKRKGPKRDIAFLIGKHIAEKAKVKGISSVVFDRGGFVYHGRVQKFAEGAREGGLKF